MIGTRRNPLALALGVQVRQFSFEALLFELRRTSVYPGLTMSQQAVDQHREIVRHRFDGGLESG